MKIQIGQCKKCKGQTFLVTNKEGQVEEKCLGCSK